MGCECGDPDADRCAEAWSGCLAQEFEDPEFFKVHHLTVTAYRVQHRSALEADVWARSREVLRRFVEDGVGPELVRRQVAAGAVVPLGPAPPAAAPSDGTAAPARIAQVRTHAAAVYIEDMQRYAEAVLAAS